MSQSQLRDSVSLYSTLKLKYVAGYLYSAEIVRFRYLNAIEVFECVQVCLCAKGLYSHTDFTFEQIVDVLKHILVGA